MEKEEILKIFGDYVSGIARLSDLEDWVLIHLQAILASGDQKAIAMIDQVDALLIEISAGVALEEELFNRISGFVSDTETQRLSLSINAAPDFSFRSVEQSTGDAPTARSVAVQFCPYFV